MQRRATSPLTSIFNPLMRSRYFSSPQRTSRTSAAVWPSTRSRYIVSYSLPRPNVLCAVAAGRPVLRKGRETLASHLIAIQYRTLASSLVVGASPIGSRARLRPNRSVRGLRSARLLLFPCRRWPGERNGDDAIVWASLRIAECGARSGPCKSGRLHNAE